MSVQEGVKVRGNTSIFRAGRTALSQRLEEGNDSYSSKNSIVTLFSCFNLTISLPWEIRNSFKVATSLLISFLNFSSMSSFGILSGVNHSFRVNIMEWMMFYRVLLTDEVLSCSSETSSYHTSLSTHIIQFSHVCIMLDQHFLNWQRSPHSQVRPGQLVTGHWAWPGSWPLFSIIRKNCFNLHFLGQLDRKLEPWGKYFI